MPKPETWCTHKFLKPVSGTLQACLEVSQLFEEPENLLKQELREPAVYNSIITAVAGGASRQNEIAEKAGLPSAVCSKYIRILLELEILGKEMPVAEKSGKRTVYRIKDPFFRFWYRFVPQNMSAICAGRIDRIYEKAVKQALPEYMGLIFEDMCRDFLLRYAEDFPFYPGQIGQWWGTDPKAHRQVQIDIVGAPAAGDEYLIGYANTGMSRSGWTSWSCCVITRKCSEKAADIITAFSQKADSRKT